MVNWLGERVGQEGFDLGPYRPLIDAARRVLQYRAVNDEDWYSARMYYQLRTALGELPR